MKNYAPIEILIIEDNIGDIELAKFAFNEAYKKYANSYIVKPAGIDKFIDVAKKIEDFWVNLSKLPKS